MGIRGSRPVIAGDAEKSRLGLHVGAGASLVLLVAVVYGRAVHHEFVFDDWHLVVGNEVVTAPLSQIGDVIEHRLGGVSYRPVRMISYMVDYQLAGGIDAFVFHLTNLVYHGVAVLLLYALAWLTLDGVGSQAARSAAALFAAALFAVHPLGSEAVAYVSGRRDVLAGLFLLIGLIGWWLFCAELRKARLGVLRAGFALVLALLGAGLAVGAKENAMVFPALAGLLFVVSARRGDRPGGSSWVPAAALLVAALLLWGVVDRFYLDRVEEAWARLSGPPLAPQPALSLSVLGQYGWLALWPASLSADYRPPAWDLPVVALDSASLLSGVALIGVLLAGGLLVWRGRVAGVGLLWFPLSLLPVAQIVPYGEIVAEHNAYIGLAGLALAAGEGFAFVLPRAPRAAAAVALGLVLLLGVRAHARTADWADDETLWAETLEARPSSVRAKQNLATAYARRGQLPRARELLQTAYRESPDEPVVVAALATVEIRLGNEGEALELAERAATLDPSSDRLAFLGWVQLSTGADATAKKTFRRALAMNPRDPEARRGLAQLRLRAQQREHLRHGRSR